MTFQDKLVQHLNGSFAEAIEEKLKLDNGQRYINEKVKRFEEGIKHLAPVTKGEVEVDYGLNRGEYFAFIKIQGNTLSFKRNSHNIEVYTREGLDAALSKLDVFFPSSDETCISQNGDFLNDDRFDLYLEETFKEIVN